MLSFSSVQCLLSASVYTALYQTPCKKEGIRALQGTAGGKLGPLEHSRCEPPPACRGRSGTLREGPAAGEGGQPG